MENFQRAFFMPKLFDNNSVEQWQADGSKDTIQRGLEGAKKLLEDYQEPKLDEAKDEELLDYIAKRETTIPKMEALNQEH
jgi:trimethylamine--corrinoid protein Co-methyltransferase